LRTSGSRALVALTGLTCVVCFFATKKLTGTVQRLTLKRGMFGYDINKKGTPAGEVRVPEAAGLAPAAVFLASLCVLQVAHVWLGGENAKEWAVEHNSALATIGFAVFLGFVDDVLELPWRAKMILPAFAAMPLLLSYAGSTTILVPRPLRKALELALGSGAGDVGLLDLGPLYYVYMFLLTIFCSNSINIHAGINGLEAGQSAVIAAAMVSLNVCTIAATGRRASEAGQTVAGTLTASEAMKRALALRAVLGDKSQTAMKAAAEAQALVQGDVVGASMHDAHIFSLCLTAPFLACTLGLLAHNWYPSKVFVGDTYTYFAGMTLGVAGILGHFSETLVLFFLPQIANFLYSAPQLFKLVPCPRHRLPRLDVRTGLLHPSFVTQEEGETRVNMNLVNLFLRVLGPQTERRLFLAMLTLQAGCCAAGFGVRAILTGIWK
jgi:UDP-N-acetylglucosamine--dolichyl-phosphate N-acetylglucosaminephosphotransferase